MKFLRDVPLTGATVELIIYAFLALSIVIVILAELGFKFRRAGWDKNLLFSGGVLVAAGIVAVGSRFLLESVWRPFPDKIDLRIYATAAAAIAVIVIGIRQVVRRRKFSTVAAVLLATVISLTSAFAMSNVVYHIYPNAYSLLGGGSPKLTKVEDLPAVAVDKRNGPLVNWWTAADVQSRPDVKTLPTEGRVVSLNIGNQASGFRTTAARVYLPPAYFADPSPQLPVLVLVAGVPGAPDDWFSVGEVHEALDNWAASHSGLAPIVVAVDGNGSQFHDTLCVDSPEGNVMTYLGKDVPREIIQRFHADPSPERWAIGGLSRGGTCSLQMVANYPDRFSTFLDMSGELHPSAGTVAETIKRYFGGDARAYAAVGAETILTSNQGTSKFAHVAGSFIAGTKDKEAQVDLQQLNRLAQAAAMNTTYRQLEGGHTWQVWRAGFATSLDWIGNRLGLVR